MKKLFIFIIVAFLLYYFIHKFLKRKKYLDFFKDMGFGESLLSKFTTDELFNSYNYIVNYSRKGIKLTASIDPMLYSKVKSINDKYHIFTNL